MEDDLNAPRALALVWEGLKSDLSAAEKLAFVQFADTLLGLDLLKEPVAQAPAELPQEVQAILDERAAARKAKDWKKSDELRAQLDALGFAVKDTPQGQQVTHK